MQEDSGLAVRVALGETKIIDENKAFLKSHGVNLGALAEKVRRVLIASFMVAAGWWNMLPGSWS